MNHKSKILFLLCRTNVNCVQEILNKTQYWLKSGGSIMSRKAQEWPDTNENGTGILLFSSGIAAVCIGIPNTVSDAKKKQKLKSEKDEINRSKGLSLRTSPNGVTLVLNF